MWKSERILNTLTNYSSSIQHSSIRTDADVTEDHFDDKIPSSYNESSEARSYYILEDIADMTAYELSDVWYEVLYLEQEHMIQRIKIYEEAVLQLVNQNITKNEAKRQVIRKITTAVDFKKKIKRRGKLMKYFLSSLQDEDEEGADDSLQYLHAIYWALMTVLAVGHKDVVDNGQVWEFLTAVSHRHSNCIP